MGVQLERGRAAGRVLALSERGGGLYADRADQSHDDPGRDGARGDDGVVVLSGDALWSKQGESVEEKPAQQEAAVPDFTLLEGEGAQAWRWRLQQENRNNVIVFVDQYLGIFHTAEFSILAGLRIKSAGIPAELGTAADILQRYGSPERT